MGMLRKTIAVWLLYLLCFVGAACAAEIEIPPAPRGKDIYVQDYAGVLPPETRTQLARIGANLEARTKAQLVVVTQKSLDGAPIESYTLALLRGWGVGDKTLQNGVVLLVAVDDRQSRVEVGYGLEGALPDARTGQIQDEYMLPHFRTGQYAQGILDGYTALARRIADEYKVSLGGLPPFKKAAAAPQPQGGLLDSLMDFVVAGVVLVLVVLDFTLFGGRFTLLLLALFRSRGGGGGGGGFGGGSGGGGGSSRRW